MVANSEGGDCLNDGRERGKFRAGCMMYDVSKWEKQRVCWGD